MSGYIYICAGGTGGHISPGIALAEEFHKQGKKVVIIATQRNISNPDLKQPVALGIDVYYSKAQPPGKSPKQIIKFLIGLMKSIKQLSEIQKTKPATKIVTMGGYSSAPGILFSKWKKLPLYLCEQNCVPGAVNRLFGRWAAKIFLSYPLSRKKIKIKDLTRIEMPGNPVRTKFYKIGFGKKRTRPIPKKPKILFMGGSQGARQINLLLSEILSIDSSFSDKYQITVITGGQDLPPNMHGNTAINVIDYTTEIEEILAVCDLIVARSGAGLLAEASGFSIPMILIPYPYAADNHQLDNALFARDRNAAWVLEGKDIHALSLANGIDSILTNSKSWQAMSEASFQISAPEAANNIVASILS